MNIESLGLDEVSDDKEIDDDDDDDAEGDEVTRLVNRFIRQCYDDLNNSFQSPALTLLKSDPNNQSKKGLAGIISKSLKYVDNLNSNEKEMSTSTITTCFDSFQSKSYSYLGPDFYITKYSRLRLNKSMNESKSSIEVTSYNDRKVQKSSSLLKTILRSISLIDRDKVTYRSQTSRTAVSGQTGRNVPMTIQQQKRGHQLQTETGAIQSTTEASDMEFTRAKLVKSLTCDDLELSQAKCLKAFETLQVIMGDRKLDKSWRSKQNKDISYESINEQCVSLIHLGK